MAARCGALKSCVLFIVLLLGLIVYLCHCDKTYFRKRERDTLSFVSCVGLPAQPSWRQLHLSINISCSLA